MSQVARGTKTGSGTINFAANTNALASEVNADFNAIIDSHNQHDDGTLAWQRVRATNASAVPLVANNSTGTNNIFEVQDNGTAVLTVADGGIVTLTGSFTVPTATITALVHAIMSYRRPVLKFISATTVDVENNTGTANQTTILFPDGSARSVTEDTSAANKYRRFIITADAEFTAGTEDSGLRAALSEATNTWYAIYAVKSQIDATKFVLVGDTTLPVQASFATLNTAYGTDSWVHLGMIRNGDNSGTTGDVLNFTQSGNRTNFINTATGQAFNGAGIRVASQAGGVAAFLTYTYAAGTGAAEIPANLGFAAYAVAGAATADPAHTKMTDASEARTYALAASEQGFVATITLAASDGAKIENNAGSTAAADIYLAGFIDSVLGIGSNPLL